MKTFYISLVLIMNFFTLCCQDIKVQKISSGPSKGTLIIIGGGEISESLNKKIMETSGGLQIPIVVIPTADGNDNYDENFGEAGLLRKMGATNVIVLHTNDRNIANSEEFVKPLLSAKLVWFSGGRQWRLVDVYKNKESVSVRVSLEEKRMSVLTLAPTLTLFPAPLTAESCNRMKEIHLAVLCIFTLMRG